MSSTPPGHYEHFIVEGYLTFMGSVAHPLWLILHVRPQLSPCTRHAEPYNVAIAQQLSRAAPMWFPAPMSVSSSRRFQKWKCICWQILDVPGISPRPLPQSNRRLQPLRCSCWRILSGWGVCSLCSQTIVWCYRGKRSHTRRYQERNDKSKRQCPFYYTSSQSNTNRPVPATARTNECRSWIH